MEGFEPPWTIRRRITNPVQSTAMRHQQILKELPSLLLHPKDKMFLEGRQLF